MGAAQSGPRVINYDANGYDYRNFWKDRDYENRVEAKLLRSILKKYQPMNWFADLGGGFGRNAPIYFPFARHVVLIDYSWTNLTNAEATLLPDGPNDKLYLIRGNLYKAPFKDAAFTAGATVRVIHHLAKIDEALSEMSRILANRWILDVPIKNHLFAKAKAALHGGDPELKSPNPHLVGTEDEPFYNFNLSAIRAECKKLGWQSQLTASMSNFRRWEKATPSALRPAAQPFIYSMDALAQRIGRGWWGPSQFLQLTRQEETRNYPEISTLDEPWKTLSAIVQCPLCHAELNWSNDTAQCTACGHVFSRKGAIWDFTGE